MELMSSHIKSQKRTHLLIVIFIAYLTTFIIILCGAFIGEWLQGHFFIPSIAVFFLLGLMLIYLTIKEKVKGMHKKFLILAGGSGAGFFIFVLLHNFFYALGVIAGHIIILKYLMEFLHVVFFLVAVLVCPIGLLIGVLGSIVLFIKNKKKS